MAIDYVKCQWCEQIKIVMFSSTIIQIDFLRLHLGNKGWIYFVVNTISAKISCGKRSCSASDKWIKINLDQKRKHLY